MKNIKDTVSILGGVVVLCLGFYFMYLGSEIDKILLVLAGVLVAIIGAIIIYIFRHKHNMKLIYNYKKAIEDLGKDPDNQELIEKAYKYGAEFYRTRSGGSMLSIKEKKVLEKDILYARVKLK